MPVKSLAHIPGSSSLWELVRMLRNPSAFVRERTLRHGPVWKSRFFFPVVFAVGPDASREIFIGSREDLSHKGGYEKTAFGRLFERSLILLDGEEHRRDRELLQPAVGRLGLSSVLDSVRDTWLRTLGTIQPGASIDAYDLTQRATFEVSANCLINLELGEELAEFEPLFDTLIAGSMAATRIPWPFGRLRRGMKAREELIRRLAPKIESARTKAPSGMVGLLAHARDGEGAPLTTRRIAEHLLLLYWAGYDTTASTGAWLLYELAANPDWQERLAHEQWCVLGGRPLDMAENNDRAMPLHTWVLRENERLHPSVFFLARRATADTSIGGHAIPNGTVVFTSPFMTHRMPDLFDAPDEFDPARWDPERGPRQAPQAALCGFGGGPRICLGKAFALMQLRVLLTTVLQRFRLRLDPDHTMKQVPLPMNRPKDAHIIFEPRDTAHGQDAGHRGYAQPNAADASSDAGICPAHHSAAQDTAANARMELNAGCPFHASRQ